MRSTNSNGSMDGASSGGDQLQPPQQQSSSAPLASLQQPLAPGYSSEEIKKLMSSMFPVADLPEQHSMPYPQQQEGRSHGLPYPHLLSGISNGRRDSHEDSPPKPTKSNNTTECVRVPSSEHVAEIVGRQGCKIKALRAKTNTYIKTPVRGEEPVFVVTGRRDDVSNAVREILSAADHFTAIRAQRRNSTVSCCSNGNGASQGPPSPNTPGQVSCKVKVPYNFVGLVVGPKGQTVKTIQQKTSTYIVTPNRAKSPVFDVTGTPDEVKRAAEQIEGHIRERGKVPVQFHRNGPYDYEVVIDHDELNRRGGVTGSGNVGALGGVAPPDGGGLYSNFRHNTRRDKETGFQARTNGDLPPSSSSSSLTPGGGGYDGWYGGVGGGGNLTGEGEHAPHGGDHFDDSRDFFTFDFANTCILKDAISAFAGSTTTTANPGSQNFFMNGSASHQQPRRGGGLKTDSSPLTLGELGHYGVDALEYRNGSASNGSSNHHPDSEVFHLGSEPPLGADRTFRLREAGSRTSPPRTEWNGPSSRDDSPFPLVEPRLSAPPRKAPNGVQQSFTIRDIFPPFYPASYDLGFSDFSSGSPSSLTNGCYNNGSSSSLANSFGNGSPGGLSNGYSNGSSSSLSSGMNGGGPMSSHSLPTTTTLSNGLPNGLSSGLENGLHGFRNGGGSGSFGPFNLPELGNLESSPLSQQLARMNITCSGGNGSELPVSSGPLPSTSSTLCSSSSSSTARPITSTFYSSCSTPKEAVDGCVCRSSNDSSPRGGMVGSMEGGHGGSSNGSPLGGEPGRSAPSTTTTSESDLCQVCGSHDDVIALGSGGSMVGLTHACTSCANSHKSPILRNLTPIDF